MDLRGCWVWMAVGFSKSTFRSQQCRVVSHISVCPLVSPLATSAVRVGPSSQLISQPWHVVIIQVHLSHESFLRWCSVVGVDEYVMSHTHTVGTVPHSHDKEFFLILGKPPGYVRSTGTLCRWRAIFKSLSFLSLFPILPLSVVGSCHQDHQ